MSGPSVHIHEQHDQGTAFWPCRVAAALKPPDHQPRGPRRRVSRSVPRSGCSRQVPRRLAPLACGAGEAAHEPRPGSPLDGGRLAGATDQVPHRFRARRDLVAALCGHGLRDPAPWSAGHGTGQNSWRCTPSPGETTTFLNVLALYRRRHGEPGARLLRLISCSRTLWVGNHSLDGAQHAPGTRGSDAPIPAARVVPGATHCQPQTLSSRSPLPGLPRKDQGQETGCSFKPPGGVAACWYRPGRTRQVTRHRLALRNRGRSGIPCARPSLPWKGGVVQEFHLAGQRRRVAHRGSRQIGPRMSSGCDSIHPVVVTRTGSGVDW